jgi:hypothetical protein
MSEAKVLKKRRVVNKMVISVTILMLFSYIYFSVFGSYIFLYQEKQILFTFASDYLSQFVSKPGGLLVYAGNFFTQFFFYHSSGSLIFSMHIGILVAICYIMIKEIAGENAFTLPFALVLPCLLILLQSDFNTPIYYAEGFLLVSISYLIVLRSSGKKWFILILAGFPLLYFVSGAFALLSAILYCIHNLIERKFMRALIMTLICLLTLYVSQIIFFQTFKDLITFPITPYPRSLFIFTIAACFLVLFPVFLQLLRTKVIQEADKNISSYLVLVEISLSIFILSRFYNPEITHLFRLEKMVQEEKWEDVISYQEKLQSRNIVAQYYYNLALSETDQLCDRLFSSRQDFGPGSLMVQWDSRMNINQIWRGAYFFYSINLINEAHRWAYESMVMQGYRPENIKMLVKTELIRGNYKVAARYIDLLMQTLHYRHFAEAYEKFLYNPELIISDPEMGTKIKSGPVSDFLIRLKDQQANVPLLLMSSKSNKRAFEYMMAWFMLERKPEKVREEIYRIDSLGYKKIPEHIAEALFIQEYRSGSLNGAGKKTDSVILRKFEAYQNEKVQTSKNGIRKYYRNTFWYYFDSGPAI